MNKWIKYNFKYDCLKEWDIFCSESFFWKTTRELKDLYLSEHIAWLDWEIKSRIDSIVNNAYNLWRLDTISPIVLVPIYFREVDSNIRQVINLIKNQKGNTQAVLFLNWHWDLSEFEAKKQFLQSCLGMDDKFIVFSHFYKKKPLIWTVISDLYDSIISKIEIKEDTILLRLDSDNYHIDDDYVSHIKDHFDCNLGISYVNSEIACSHIDDNPFGWFAELIVNLAEFRNNKNTKRVPTVWSCLAIRLSDWMKIKWTQRDAYRLEDWVISQKVSQLYWSYYDPDNSRGKWSGKKVYSSPRRQLNNLEEGRFYNRNKHWFEFIEITESSDNNIDLDIYNNIMYNILNEKYVPLDQLILIENYINNFNNKLKNISKVLKGYRDENMLKNSLYTIYINKNKLVEFIEK